MITSLQKDMKMAHITIFDFFSNCVLKRSFHSLFKEYRVQPKEFSYTNLTSVAHTNNLSVILMTKSLNNLILIRFCKTMEITTPQKLIFSGSPP